MCVCDVCVFHTAHFAHTAAPPPATSLAAGNGLRSGRKVLRRPLMGQKIVDWYPGDPLKADPLMPNFKADK